MSIARKIVLLVAMALAAMALTATTASAQETGVEVINEATGNPCNPCAVTVSGESHIRAMPANVIVSSCRDTFSLRINHNTGGEIEWVGLNDITPPGCVTTNCVVGSAHWTVRRLGELGNGTEHAYVDFCLRAGTTEITCTGEVIITAVGDHIYRFATPAGGISCLDGARIVEGTWTTTTSAVELVHAVN